MKQTIEEAEKEYCDKNYPYSDLNIRLMVENAFEAGAESDGEDPPFIYCDDMNPFKFADLVAAATATPAAPQAGAAWSWMTMQPDKLNMR